MLGGMIMININFRDPRPIYEQIKDGLRRLMVTGVLPQDSRLPSVRELASELAINPSTIQRAYRELELEGYICSVAGKGSFVCGTDEAKESRRMELLEKFDRLVAELELVNVTKTELIGRLKGE